MTGRRVWNAIATGGVAGQDVPGDVVWSETVELKSYETQLFDSRKLEIHPPYHFKLLGISPTPSVRLRVTKFARDQHGSVSIVGAPAMRCIASSRRLGSGPVVPVTRLAPLLGQTPG